MDDLRVAFIALNSYPLFFSTGEPVGGAEVQQYLLARELKRHIDIAIINSDFGQRAVEVRDGMIFVKTPHVPSLGSISEFRLSPPYIYRFASLAEYNPQKWYRPLWQSLHRAMNMADGDIFFQMMADWSTIATAHYCKNMRRRFVFATASDEDCTLHRRRERERKMLFRAIREADAVVVQTQRQKEAIEESMGIDAMLIPSIWPTTADVASGDGDYVLWAGRIDENKRPQVVVELAEKLPEVRFVMLGYPGDRDLYERIKAKAKKLPNLDFVGFVPFHKTARYFRDARAVLNTSEIEGVPNTFFQAWEYGRSVVTLDIDPDDILSKGAGFVARDVDELVDILRELWHQPEKARKAGLRGRRLLEERHLPSTIAEEYLNLFHSLSP